MEINKQSDEIEIDIRQIMGVLLRNIVIIILAGLIVGLIALLTSKLFLKPVYESSTKLYIINRQNETATTYNDIQSSTQLTKDYKILVTSRTVTERVIGELNLDMTANQLASSITVNTPTDTRILEITVANHDQYKAKEIADKVAQISSDSICRIMQIEDVNIVDEANFPSTPVSPNVKKNTLIGGALGILLAAAIVIIRYLMNDTIRNSEDIERYFGISTLALIPIADELNDEDKLKKKIKDKKKKKKVLSNDKVRKPGENIVIN